LDACQAPGLRAGILRYFNAAGADPDGDLREEHDPETHLIPLAIDAALGTAPPLKVFGTDYPTPDGTCIRDYIHVTDLAGGHPVCLTCDSTSGWDDGVRWQPGGDVLVFVSSRDHPGFVGGAGGGAGQELYAMRADGSQQTRLTVSPDWATNYHVNWSFDGRRIVWGSTTDRTWDVMVADLVDDAPAVVTRRNRTVLLEAGGDLV
jgi:hypothetical protein